MKHINRINSFYSDNGVKKNVVKYTKYSIHSDMFINSFLYDHQEYNTLIRSYKGQCTKRRYDLFSKEFLKIVGNEFELFLGA